MIVALVVVAAVILLPLILIVAGGMLIVVGGQQVGVVERRYFGRTLPAGRVVAMRDEVGVQARVLPPGLHIMFPFIYVVRKTGMLMISEDEVGILESIDGLSLEPGRRGTIPSRTAKRSSETAARRARRSTSFPPASTESIPTSSRFALSP